jgi:hypothetical protein
VRTENLKQMGIQYGALGRYTDYHEIRDENGQIRGCYPGSAEWLAPEGINDKRIVLVSCEEARPLLTSIHTSPRKYRHLELTEEDMDRASILHFLDAADLSEDDLVRLSLAGRCSARNVPEIASLLHELGEKYFCFRAENQLETVWPERDAGDDPGQLFTAALEEACGTQTEGFDEDAALVMKFGFDLLDTTVKP